MKYIGGRSFTTFPEWAKIGLFSLSGMLLAVILFNASSPKVRYVEQKPHAVTFYITNRDEYTNIDGRIVYALEYSLDGSVQIVPNFPTEAARDRFEMYLTTIGTVQQ
jgi:hypothetical protein